MPVVGSFMMGATLVRALRSGVIFSDGVGYDVHQQPRKFASMTIVHGTGALLFAWLAVGGIAHAWRLVLPH
jgi:hypothetical protein